MFKRFRLLLALLALVALVAAACGSDDETTETSDTTAAPTTTEAMEEEETTTTEAMEEEETTTTEAPAPTAELTVWADDTRTPVFQEFGAQFEADTGVKVNVIEVDFGDIDDNLIQQGPAGEGADIIITAHDTLGALVESGVVAPIDLPTASEFEQVGLNAFAFDGQLYGVPIAIENLGLFRNTDLVPEQITDWNDLVAAGEALLADGTADVIVSVQNAADPDVYHNYPLQTMYGSYIFGLNDDGTYNPSDLGIATDEGKAYAAAWKTWIDTGVLDVTLDPDTAKQAFTEGRAPFYITGSWNLNDVRDSGVNFAIDPFPILDGTQGAPFVGVQGIMINAFSENPLIAQAFTTDYMATQEAQYQLFELGGRAPAHSAALAEASAADASIGGFGAAGAAGQPQPAIPEMGAVWGNLTNGYKLVRDGTDPGEAFQEAQDLIAAEIGG